MLQTSLKYGLYSGIIMIIFFSITWFALKDISFGIMEVLGYIGMIVGLSVIYFGIKHIRDKIFGGSISFKDAFLYGSLMAAIGAIIFGVLDTIYMTVLNPDFSDQYLNYMIEKAKSSGRTEEQIQKTIEQYTTQMENYTPVFNFFVMFGTVLLLGVIMSLIFSAILKRKLQPA
ncbi:MAG: DUF4199 domain-containing protein [Fimbriimonadaceae bacterium]|nr:DUF4199 domain-containing protein [Chitinophagales bacterium]